MSLYDPEGAANVAEEMLLDVVFETNKTTSPVVVSAVYTIPSTVAWLGAAEVMRILEIVSLHALYDLSESEKYLDPTAICRLTSCGTRVLVGCEDSALGNAMGTLLALAFGRLTSDAIVATALIERAVQTDFL